MTKEFSRSKRVAHQIRKLLAMYLEKNRSDLVDGLLTISAANVSPDLKNARIFVTFLGKQGDAIEEIISRLNADANIYQRYLASQLKLRVTPKLYFEYDFSLAKSDRVMQLIDKANQSIK